MTDLKPAALKRCLCGGVAIMENGHNDSTKGRYAAFVRCSKCHITMPGGECNDVKDFEKLKQMLVAEWNQRATSASVSPMGETVKVCPDCDIVDCKHIRAEREGNRDTRESFDVIRPLLHAGEQASANFGQFSIAGDAPNTDSPAPAIQPDALVIRRLLVEELQTAHTEDDYSYHDAADDLYLRLCPYLRSPSPTAPAGQGDEQQREERDDIKQDNCLIRVIPLPDWPECAGDSMESAADLRRRIAAMLQLPVREQTPDHATGQGDECSDLMEKCYSAFGIGKHARSERTLLANISNAARRSACLSFIEGFLEIAIPDEDGDCPLNWGDAPKEYLEKFKAVWKARPKAVPTTPDHAALLKQMTATLIDGCLWVDEMQIGVNKWAADAVGLLARQDNLNAWKTEAKEMIAAYHQAMTDDTLTTNKGE